jgi:DNA-binding beta-propeller fold protein YncE
VQQVGWMTYTSDAETTYNPYALFVDSQGQVFIADYNTSTVRVFSPQGDLLSTLFEDERHQFGGLGDLLIDETRNFLYVVDFDNGTVEQFLITFDSDAIPTVNHNATFGSYGRAPGELAFPQGLALDTSTGLLYVGDQANRRIQVFDPQGNYVRHFAPPEVQDWQVLGMEFGQNGLLYAADALNNSIWVFSPEGEMIQHIEVDR